MEMNEVLTLLISFGVLIVLIMSNSNKKITPHVLSQAL